MFKRLIESIRFYLKTGIRRSTVHRVFRDLSNLYLTPTNPGKTRKLTVVTSLPMLKIQFGEAITYWVDRKGLRVVTETRCKDIKGQDKIFHSEPFPFEQCLPIVELVKGWASKGIPFPRNNEGVKYYAMPGEEEFNGKAR